MPRKSRNFIRKWRKLKQLTQEQLAERIGMSKPSISCIENGNQPYSEPVLEAIAHALQCEPADLLRPPSDPALEEWNRLLNKLTQDKSAKALRLIKTFLDDSEVA